MGLVLLLCEKHLAHLAEGEQNADAAVEQPAGA